MAQAGFKQFISLTPIKWKWGYSLDLQRETFRFSSSATKVIIAAISHLDCSAFYRFSYNYDCPIQIHHHIPYPGAYATQLFHYGYYLLSTWVAVLFSTIYSQTPIMNAKSFPFFCVPMPFVILRPNGNQICTICAHSEYDISFKLSYYHSANCIDCHVKNGSSYIIL